MTQLSGNQFDDDLTVGMDAETSFSTDSIDLFEFTGDEGSPIARLKTIILSIDWEITDEILHQLEEELMDLADIWSEDKIKLVYIQGLSKIGKYIYKEKASANPNAIKLLIRFFHNLEKIESLSGKMTGEDKKQLLLADVEKFDYLKAQIGKSDDSVAAVVPVRPVQRDDGLPIASLSSAENNDFQELKTIKAIVLGIDWEINDKALHNLGEEVKRLDNVFGGSKAKLILLQGIGALSTYINKMRSKSNSSAFTLLHSFYGALETITRYDLPVSDEKQLLLAEVAKFNEFKAVISSGKQAVQPPPLKETATPAPVAAASAVPEPAIEEQPVSAPKPPLAAEEVDSDDDGSGKVASDISSKLEDVFGVDGEQKEEAADESLALKGVNVETEADDDSDEEALPIKDGGIAPALSMVEEESSFSVEKLAGDLVVDTIAVKLAKEAKEDVSLVQGVDVETEVDDDSGESTLPMDEGKFAPALSSEDGKSGFSAESLDLEIDESNSADLEDRLDTFFDDSSSSEEELIAESSAGVETDVSGSEYDDIVAALNDTAETEDSSEYDDIVAALNDTTETEESDFLYEEVVSALSEPSVLEEDVSGEVLFGSETESEPDEFVDSLKDIQEPEEEGIEEVDSMVESEASFVEVVPALGDSPAFEEEGIDEEDSLEELPSTIKSDSNLDALAPAFGDASEREEKVTEKISTIIDNSDTENDAVEVVDTLRKNGIDEVELESEESMSFLDDDVAAPEFQEGEVNQFVAVDESFTPALEFVDETDSFESVLEETEKITPAEDVESEVVEGLSFLDDDVPEPIFADDEEGVLVFPKKPLDEDVDASKEKEDAGLALDYEDEIAQTENYDAGIEPTATEIEQFIEEESDDSIDLELEDESDESDSEIAFTVPGDDLYESAAFSGVAAGKEDDLIEFSVPGEDVDDAAVRFGVEEVLFEVVADDTVIDPLPGAAFDDKYELKKDPLGVAEESEDADRIEIELTDEPIEAVLDEERIDSEPESGQNEEDPVAIVAVEDENNADDESEEELAEFIVVEDEAIVDLSRLKGYISDLVRNSETVSYDDIYIEINRARNYALTGSISKIYLQLLSTVCQHEERNNGSKQHSFLLQDIFFALEYAESSEGNNDEVQSQLLDCTSRVLFLQQYALINSAQAEVTDDTQVIEQAEPVAEEVLESSPLSQEVSGQDVEKLADFVYKELADIRQLFIDEIGSLRKEMVEK